MSLTSMSYRLFDTMPSSSSTTTDEEADTLNHQWRDLSSDTTLSSATLQRSTSSSSSGTTTDFIGNEQQYNENHPHHQSPMTVYVEDCTFTQEDANDEEDEELTLSWGTGTQESDTTTGTNTTAEPQTRYYRPIFSTGHIHLNNVTMNGHSSKTIPIITRTGSVNGGTITTTTTSSTTTLFAVNIVNGTALLEDCTFSNNAISSIVRPIQNSHVIIRRSTFDHNLVLGTVVSVGSSSVTLEQCFLQDNLAVGAEVLLYESSFGLVQDSCFITSVTTTTAQAPAVEFATILVDSTSQLEQKGNNFAGSMVVDLLPLNSSLRGTLIPVEDGGQEVSTPGDWNDYTPVSQAPICSPGGHVLFETSQEKCLRPTKSGDEGCQGYCESLPSPTCPVPELWAAVRAAAAAATAGTPSSASAPLLWLQASTFTLLCTATMALSW
jgi:hypothetical protein